MRNMVLTGLITAAVALAGCGGVEVNSPPPTPTPATSASVAGPLTVTLTRTGGIAGVQETVVIDTTGSWTYTDQRRGQSERGQFTPAQLALLGQLALDPRLVDEMRAGTPGVCADAFQYSLTVGAQRYRFEDCGQPRPAMQAILAVIAEATPL